MVAHALRLPAIGLRRRLADLPFGNGLRDVCRLWRVVLLVLVLVVVPEIRTAFVSGVFPVPSPIAVPWRPVRMMCLRDLPVALLVTSRSPAPAMPPVRPLLASGPVHL